MRKTPVSLLQRLSDAPAQHDWQRFVQLYTPLLIHWARRTGLNEHDAEDLVQEVLASVLKAMNGFRYDTSGSFRAWLKTIMINKWRDRQRMASRRLAPTSLGELQVAAPEDEDFFDHEYRDWLLRRAIELVRSEFEVASWRAFEETAICGKPPQVVALELGVSVNAVYIARSRILKRLHDELDGLLE